MFFLIFVASCLLIYLDKKFEFNMLRASQWGREGRWRREENVGFVIKKTAAKLDFEVENKFRSKITVLSLFLSIFL